MRSKILPHVTLVVMACEASNLLVAFLLLAASQTTAARRPTATRRVTRPAIMSGYAQIISVLKIVSYLLLAHVRVDNLYFYRILALISREWI
jgi:hypothetical protein